MNAQYAQRSRDRIILMKLAEVAEPTSYDKVMLGGLMMRYHMGDFRDDIELVIRSWNLTPKQLFLQCREIWSHGFRPDHLEDEGSSWDAKPGE